jgi:hypothetical protein
MSVVVRIVCDTNKVFRLLALRLDLGLALLTFVSVYYYITYGRSEVATYVMKIDAILSSLH